MSKKSSVSVVIPSYNGKALLEKNLPAVLAASNGAEIVVVDDASSDETVVWLRRHYPAVKIVQHNKNQRFAAACNSGVSAASGEIIILLNNDVVPDANFLPPLLAHFDDEAVFAVGCAENVGEQMSGRSGGDFVRGMYVHWKASQQIAGSTLWVAAGSGAFRKATWLEIGGMDERFAPAYEEDRDICYRALKRNYKVLFEPRSRVQHKHETTNVKTLGTRRMKASSYKNHFLFVWKNLTSPSLASSHIFWLPYQLSIGLVKSGGYSMAGFLWGLTYLPSIVNSRNRERLEQKVADETIIAVYKNI